MRTAIIVRTNSRIMEPAPIITAIAGFLSASLNLKESLLLIFVKAMIVTTAAATKESIRNTVAIHHFAVIPLEPTHARASSSPDFASALVGL